MARLVRAVLEFNTLQPQIDFCCFRSLAINIALTHRYKLVSFLNLIAHIINVCAVYMISATCVVWAIQLQ